MAVSRARNKRANKAVSKYILANPPAQNPDMSKQLTLITNGSLNLE